MKIGDTVKVIALHEDESGYLPDPRISIGDIGFINSEVGLNKFNVVFSNVIEKYLFEEIFLISELELIGD